MSIEKELPELIQAGVISGETADRIREHYKTKSKPSTNRLFTVFGILGAILTGLGIILIIAHNWDELSKGLKTVFAFLPLLIGQIFCAFVLLKKQNSVAWRESATTFLFFAVGSSIALISQIYHIPGDQASFMLTWMLLCLPLIYLMNSSLASLLYICGISYYVSYVGYWSGSSDESYIYWLLLAAALPHYYRLYKQHARSNFMLFHNWLIPISITISLGTVAETHSELLYIAYISLFGLFHLIGNSDFFNGQKQIINAFKILGFLGTLYLLLVLSFDWFWEDLRSSRFLFYDTITSPEFLASLIITVAAGILLGLQLKRKTYWQINPISSLFIWFIPAFLLGMNLPIAVVLINLYVFAIGLLIIKDGARQDHLGILNVGLLVITALVMCRFFDAQLSFIIRGSLFVSVGVGFFVLNYWMLKKRKINEK